MEQQNNKSNTLIYLGIAAGILIVLLIAYLAWPSSSDKKEDHSSSKDKTVQQKTTATAIKGATQAASYQTTLEKEKNKIRKGLGSMVNYQFSWSTFIQNHLTRKIIPTLIFHLSMGYYFQVPAGSKQKHLSHCFYSSFQKKSKLPIFSITISAAKMTIVCTAVQFTASWFFFAFLSSLACDLGFVNLTSKQIKEEAIAQEEFTLREQVQGEQSKTFLKECQEAKKTFETTRKAREAAFKKEEVALNKKLDAIPSVEELEEAIDAAQEARDNAENEEDANEVKKQIDTWAALEKKLAYVNAVAANNKVKKDNKATEKQKKAAEQKVAKAKDSLKTSEYKAATAAFEAHKAHADFLQDVIDIMDTLIKRAESKKQSPTQQQK